MQEEELNYIKQLQEDNELQRQKAMQLSGALSASQSTGNPNPNLIEFQLELDSILDEIRHNLRGDILKYDEEGNLRWFKTEDEKLRLFNDNGVMCIMRILKVYLNRNTILSNYTSDEVREKMLYFSRALNNYVFNKYREFGLDTHEKVKEYPMIILEIIDTVENAFKRSVSAGERESLHTARNVVQTDNLNGSIQGSFNPPIRENRFSIFKPRSWFGK